MQNSPLSCTQTRSNGHSEDISVIKIAFLDVGQGDTIVVSSPETHEAFVVDCLDADSTLDYLEQERIQYLRGIIISHLHADHYKGVPRLLENFKLVHGLHDCELLAFNEIFNKNIARILAEDHDLHSEETFALVSEALARAKKTPLQDIFRWRAKNKSKFDDLKVRAGLPPFKGILANVKLLHPYAADYSSVELKGLNNTSIVLRVQGPNSSALLTGDLEPAGWQYLRENHSKDLQCNVLKFPHHGGAWGKTETESLLDTVKPSVIIISVGTEGEKYKHPNKEVFEVLESPPYSHIHVLCTEATNQCQASVLSQREPIIQYLDKQAESNSRKRVGSKRGCPCAGTIIVELGNEAQVVQPSIILHRDNIIRPHFHMHKCPLPRGKSVIDISELIRDKKY